MNRLLTRYTNIFFVIVISYKIYRIYFYFNLSTLRLFKKYFLDYFSGIFCNNIFLYKNIHLIILRSIFNFHSSFAIFFELDKNHMKYNEYTFCIMSTA